MWAAATPPSEEQRRAGLVAFLVVPVLATGVAAGALRIAEHDDRPPRPVVERSYVLEPAGGTEQRLISPPAGTKPAAVVAVCSPSGPAAATACPPATLTSPPEQPAPPPAPVAPPVAAPPAPPPNPAAAALANLINARLADPRLAGTTVGLSVWVEGLGEVAGHNADLALTPASNQKLFTAMGALSLIPQTDRLVTEVRATGTQEGRVLNGDLFLVGGGDPTLNAKGPHSLDDLAAAVKARGIDEVRGTLFGDESRYDTVRGAPGWLPQHVPVFIGPLSALIVDRNQLRPDADYAANPLPGTLPYFRAALLRAGVRVLGPNAAAAAPAGSAVLAALGSPTVGELVGEMLNRSDNLIAEVLVKEVGFRTGRPAAGSTAGGLSAINDAVAKLGVPMTGVAADGSGLSRADRRSAREWRSLLQAVQAQPWAERLVGSLPLAARNGTLARRFGRTAAEANVRAKTGWIDEARSLSGYLTTAGGRPVVFSVIVNGTTPTSPALNALDTLVAAIAADRS
ncbi:MAG TPA: D-alanyl-D-alanine carboxypeptidase/D-alanyl-D-alanine-endopeptidase [Acidimicrobiia bacterium]|nr:D-alanyl-D-alanine carboxypeptidase/D-alanyl-D-alanine-endopeptidase [Acidimicrobiia bacterium]